MSFCTSFYRSHCGFHVLGFPCPFERGECCFGSKENWTKYLKERASTYSLCRALLSLSLSDSQDQKPSIPPLSLPKASPPTRSFLTLPGELRNEIYRYALVVGKRPFTLRPPEKLHRERGDISLFLVNKQVFGETSTIFYHENTFRIPAELFYGTPILQALEVLHHLSPSRLRSMRSLILDIPLYPGRAKRNVTERLLMRVQEQICYNFGELAHFLGSPAVPQKDRPKVEVRFDTVGHLYPSPVHPECFWHVLNSLLVLRKGLKVHGCIWVHPCWLNEWVRLLSKHFGKDWSLQAILSPGGTPKERAFNKLVKRFSRDYKTVGLKDIYRETWDKDSYSFSPRRGPS